LQSVRSGKQVNYTFKEAKINKNFVDTCKSLENILDFYLISALKYMYALKQVYMHNVWVLHTHK